MEDTPGRPRAVRRVRRARARAGGVGGQSQSRLQLGRLGAGGAGVPAVARVGAAGQPELVGRALRAGGTAVFLHGRRPDRVHAAGPPVTSDELFAAGATFTLLAWGFAYAFSVCQAWYPGSFTGAVEPERRATWMELLFLSFTNLSAVGLGDVIPLGLDRARAGDAGAVRGCGYMAVVVSRLIGLTILKLAGAQGRLSVSGRQKNSRPGARILEQVVIGRRREREVACAAPVQGEHGGHCKMHRDGALSPCCSCTLPDLPD